MKILISAADENGKFSERFARAEYFIIYDTETKELKTEKNPFKDGEHGVGIKVAQYAADNKIDAVISIHFGPKASEALKSFGIKMYEFSGSTVQEAIEAFENGQLTANE